SFYINGQKVEAGTPIIPIFANPLWVIVGDKIVRLKNLSFTQLNIFIQNNNVITVPLAYLQYFEANYIPKIIKSLPINSSVYSVEKIIVKPQKRIYIDEINDLNYKDHRILITLKFVYGEDEVDLEMNELYHPVIKDKKIITIERDIEAEEAARNELLSFRVKETQPGKFIPRGKVLDFLFNSIPQLKTLGFEIYGEDTLKNFRVNYATPKYNVVVSSGIDWFDVKVELNYGGTTLSLNILLDALKHKKRYVQLDDGSVGILPEDWVAKFQRLAGFGEVVSGESEDGNKKLRFNTQQAKTIELLLEEAEQSKADEKFREYISKLNSFEKIEAKKIPAHFTKVLRHYQKAGYNWFYFLKEYNFGGILADDMGLGKT
ncbi:MAG: SNF2 helicase associated domain-containing protein, partial [Ignavibacteria bacterium]|nr:SNF2 helicase associated domain-containing protein [Ignavibacteria bacterium]